MTQEDRVFEYIKKNGSITSAEAFHQLGIAHLPKRINILHYKYGVKFECVWEKGTNRYGNHTQWKRWRIVGDGRKKDVRETDSHV